MYSLSVVVVLVVYLLIDVILIGGWFYKYLIVVVGVVVMEGIVCIYVDLYFMGVMGVYLVVGLSIGDFEEVVIKCVLVECVVEMVVFVL